MLMRAAKHGELLPVDSEHSALYQCLAGGREVKQVAITGSGGALRDMPRDKLPYATKEDALRHPNWKMGSKITVDSATLMNKGLEFIEARWLFDVSLDNIEVVVHPQSIVHSAVQYVDGAVMAQLGVPDMKLPIQYALFYPD